MGDVAAYYDDRLPFELDADSADAAQMRAAYQHARKAKVGTAISCPSCGRRHFKTTYHKVFCSNGKTSRGGNCKDTFWNAADPVRAERAYEWGRS